MGIEHGNKLYKQKSISSNGQAICADAEIQTLIYRSTIPRGFLAPDQQAVTWLSVITESSPNETRHR